jgi:sialidase-1
MHSDDEGLTWSEPVDITRSVKPSHWLNSNAPGAMIQLEKGPYKGRIIASLWGTVPIKIGDIVERNWEIIAAWSDDMGDTWQRSEPLEDPEIGFPNESQIAEASNGDLIIISRNQSGELKRKKAFSTDSGESWSVLETDPGLPSVACMGSIIKGPKKNDGTWDLFASFPSNQGRKDGQIAISKDHGKSWEIKGIIKGDFAYSVLQVSPDKKHLLCLYETNSSKNEVLVSIPLKNLLN